MLEHFQIQEQFMNTYMSISREICKTRRSTYMSFSICVGKYLPVIPTMHQAHSNWVQANAGSVKKRRKHSIVNIMKSLTQLIGH